MSDSRMSRALPVVATLALFAVFALVALDTSFGAPSGFPADASVTESIGYLMFGLEGSAIPGANFLAAFEIIDLVLVAALVGSVLLARREDDRADPLKGGEE